jgi:hypothetical protein
MPAACAHIFPPAVAELQHISPFCEDWSAAKKSTNDVNWQPIIREGTAVLVNVQTGTILTRW